MNTIELQLEVTRFLHRCEAVAASSGASQAGRPAGSGSPPTLFGGNNVKMEVACKVKLDVSDSPSEPNNPFRNEESYFDVIVATKINKDFRRGRFLCRGEKRAGALLPPSVYV